MRKKPPAVLSIEDLGREISAALRRVSIGLDSRTTCADALLGFQAELARARRQLKQLLKQAEAARTCVY